MTNGEFIQDRLKAFYVSDASLMTISKVVELDGELDVESAEKAMIPLLAELALAPYQKSINENGFSVSWDMKGIGWWYRYLCSKYGIKPDKDVMAAMGLSVIIDRTNKW